MCLGEVVQLLEVAGDRATARRGDGELLLSLLTLDTPVAPGDWVVAHSGFALERLDAADAARALDLRAHVPSPTDFPSPPTDRLEERP